MTNALQGAAYEIRRRKQKKEPLDAPYYVTDTEAREIARQGSRGGKDKEDAAYLDIVSGDATLYDMRLVVRG